jgi:hypothetical protein
VNDPSVASPDQDGAKVDSFSIKRFKQISAVSINDEGNEITLCAKDIILSPFAFQLDQQDQEERHNLHFN